MKALKKRKIFLYAYLFSKCILRFGMAMHLSNSFITQDESEKEANSLKRMLTAENNIPINFLSLSSSSTKKILGASSENYNSQLRGNKYLNQPDSFFSDFDNQERRKFRKINSPEAQHVDSAVLVSSPIPAEHSIKKRPYEDSFNIEGSNLPPFQPLNPIGFRDPPLQNSDFRLKSLPSSYSPSPTQTLNNIPIYYSQYINQIRNLPISSPYHNILDEHSKTSVDPKMTCFGNNLSLIKKIKSVRYQRDKNNKAKISPQQNHFEKNERAEYLELNKTPRISVHLQKLAERLENREIATSSGGLGRIDEKGKKPVGIFSEHEKLIEKVIDLSNHQLEAPIIKLITQESKMLWPTIFHDYKFLAIGAPDDKKLPMLEALHRDELKSSRGLPFSLRKNMETASFKNVVSTYFITDKSESPEWWGEFTNFRDPLKIKKFIAKTFFVYTMIINKVFCEDPNQDLFMKYEKQAVEFLSIIFDGADVNRRGRFFLNIEDIQQPSDGASIFMENQKIKTVNEFNTIMKEKRSTVEMRQLGMAWKLVELWMAQYRSDLYKKLLIKFKMRDNLKPFVNLLLILLMKFF
ncbi:hypothetical protein PPACK8108_LOCUS21451 [Phakopsora pachyrhizi]|uniref:Uncharacterized protein n=1 Tax=Phakopsora pachyrhizi TaxID=170000 RepID=A0AAV0BK97_PHAPC|nr:hypothetical protein PPACK8108_LOCUS21451 [Phakopsora pachyrhizi]